MCLPLCGQHIQPFNRVYSLPTYKVYYSDSIKTASFVIYKVYKPTIKVSRSGLNFKAYQNLPHFDYLHTPYDKGHLVPAQDRSRNLNELKSTFYYINACPQYYKVNRGSWKKLETTVHKEAMKDSLIVVCGGCDYSPKDSLVPRRLFKVVYSLSTGGALHYDIFSNNSTLDTHRNDTLLVLFPLQYLKELYVK